MVILNMMASAMFRFVAAVCRTMIVAFTGGSLALLIVFMLGGFIIPRPAIKPWWIWGYWISPLAYAENAISINEMLSSDWKKVWTRSSMICNLHNPKEVQLGLRIRMNRNGRGNICLSMQLFVTE
jgi:ABC-type multidrug transport system permease subunit